MVSDPTPAPTAAPTALAGDPTPDWRIDDLAQRAGVAVDTIRYYQREGLLPAGERAGRTLRYGPVHLERLERIRGLQARRFSLAAIRALLEHDGSVEGLLAGRDGEVFDHDSLVAAAGVSPALARGLERAGLIRAPDDYGRAAYDGEDLDALHAFADLGALGVPDALLIELAAIVTDGVDRLQHRVAALLQGTEGPGWDEDARHEFRCSTRDQSGRVVRDLRVINEYIQHRTIQRLVLETLNRP
jgi:DNA-binding transcriptional MerR regulator